MPQKFAFTTAAMAAALEETPVSYEDLADIERDFDDAETDISEFAPHPYQIRPSMSSIKTTQLPSPSATSTSRMQKLII
jgi:hypothetical protein